MINDRELFELKSGRIIMDEDLSNKMHLIKSYRPEKADSESSGFEWSEMGMANLFGILYNLAGLRKTLSVVQERRCLEWMNGGL